ncbi:DUF4082 domain-containing protein [Geomesophilobacter sediminis]|uniref:DUF4082 domain-containing protein n=1 Tax=Geomesophilobacter sediminis TaxID=2798584 RepID=A0A8J7JCH9_9BACT|nr:DUF4082 domain-containing protein [Geomesophilobacter sediminis]MBJ6724538.1 DUF4082 domain-containing protein [Geomesophilobacter sediminis]
MKSIKKLLLTAVLAVSLTAGAQAAHASLAVNFDAPADTFTQDATGSTINLIGWSFTTTSDLFVNQLGYFDLYGTGSEAHSVALYDAAGTRLASVTIGAGQGSMNGYFRMADVSSFVIAGGKSYTLAATVGSGSYAYTADTTGTEFGGTNSFSGLKFNNVTYQADAFDGDNSALPATWTSAAGVAGAVGTFGPNMDAAPTPIPGAIYLLGSGVAALAGFRRKQQ